jgi:hypothetical protein
MTKFHGVKAGRLRGKERNCGGIGRECDEA